MNQHWNVQINIQSVREPEPLKDGNSYPVKGIGGTVVMTDRRITDVLKLAVTADSEEEAYAKAHKMLNANAPGNVVPWVDASRPAGARDVLLGDNVAVRPK